MANRKTPVVRDFGYILGFLALGLLILVLAPFTQQYPNFSAVTIPQVVFDILIGVGTAFVVVALTETFVIHQLHTKLNEQMNQFSDAMQTNQSEVMEYLRQSIHSAATVFDLSVPEDYAKCWSGFAGDFYGFNPTYGLEGYPASGSTQGLKEHPELLVPVLVERYGSGVCHGRYVFFSTGEYNKQQLETFTNLLRKAQNQVRNDIMRYVEIRIAGGDSPDIEFYLGTKHGRPVGLFNARGSHYDDIGLSRFVYMVENAEAVSVLRTEFNRVWSRAKPLSANLSSGQSASP